MANHRGWWKLTVTNVDNDEHLELSDADNEHIQDCIAQGYTEGEITKDEEDWPGQNEGISAMAGDTHEPEN